MDNNRQLRICYQIFFSMVLLVIVCFITPFTSSLGTNKGAVPFFYGPERGEGKGYTEVWSDRGNQRCKRFTI
jgi:hypothetical protein